MGDKNLQDKEPVESTSSLPNEERMDKISSNEQKENQENAVKKPVKVKGKGSFFSTSHITKIAMFAALATVLGFISFPVPFLPSFLKFNLADFVFLIGTFCLGTISGSIIVVIKVLFTLFNTSTGYIGELADLLCALALVIPAGLIYKKFRTLKGAIWACSIATVSSTLVAILCNWTFLVALYARLWTWDALIHPTQAIFDLMRIRVTLTQQNFYALYLPACVLPFNLLRCLFASLITMLSYKKLSILLKRF